MDLVDSYHYELLNKNTCSYVGIEITQLKNLLDTTQKEEWMDVIKLSIVLINLRLRSLRSCCVLCFTAA